MKQPMIRFESFSFQYNAQSAPTLVDINLEIAQGEKVLIAGASGSGKSTLAHCINGLVPFCYRGEMTGTLEIAGKSAQNDSIFERSKTVGTVLQDPDGQFIGLTVAEDIAFALENDCVPQDVMRESVAKVAELTNSTELLEQEPYALSGGQKQRVSLAGILIDDVKVLLFDEPLANLDPATGKKSIELIEEIQAQTGATVIIIEHRIEDVLWCEVDRIVLMEEGRIVANLPTAELLASNLLEEHGIRAPLYISALKYAGVPVTPDLQAQRIQSLQLADAQKQQVRDWFTNATPPMHPASGKVTLAVKDLTFGYNQEKTTLNGVDLSLRKGEMVSIVGKNGAGKSTLCKLICGFEQQQKGTILLDGQDLTPLPIRERAFKIGYVMQNPNQMISKSLIYDEIALGLRNSGLTEEAQREKVEAVMKVCGIYAFRNWPISALSFGQKKRVTIASVLVLDPQIIILDEPTAGQDYRHYTDIMEFLAGLNASGVTIALITHDMHLMLEYTPRAVVFAEGHCVADQGAAAVLCDSALVEQAALKETSLFHLAQLCDLPDPVAFVERFIAYEKEVRAHGA